MPARTSTCSSAASSSTCSTRRGKAAPTGSTPSSSGRHRSSTLGRSRQRPTGIRLARLRGPARSRRSAHAERPAELRPDGPLEDRRAARRPEPAARHLLRLQPRRLRPGRPPGAAVGHPPDDRRRARRDPRDRRGPLPHPARRRPRRARLLASGSTGLERGVAAHHAGLLPAFKEVVEELFQKKLVKVVFATETLALGINMPARTVVLEKLEKFNGEARVPITPGEYTQLTGRAGRRGIDVEGHSRHPVGRRASTRRPSPRSPPGAPTRSTPASGRPTTWPST